MAGIRPPDNAAPAVLSESTEGANVHHLFSVRNMFTDQSVFFYITQPKDKKHQSRPAIDLTQRPRRRGVAFIDQMTDDAKVAARLLAHAVMCEEAAAISWNEEISIELAKLARDCRKAAAEILRARADGPTDPGDPLPSAPNQNAARNVTVRLDNEAVVNDWKTHSASRGDLAGTSGSHGGEHEIISGTRRRSLH